MRLGTVCSGIAAVEMAAKPLGWRAVWCSEIADFPNRVLAARHPESRNVGNLEALARGEVELEPVDVLVGGTPCQSFSVAGLRGGLADPRGNLALAFLELAARIRPRWVVWENVHGVLSADGGRAFGSILGGLGELGYGWAYRVLDAQYFGVAQRRRRVFVVGCAGNQAAAAAVLFERASLRGDPPPSRASREDAASSAARGARIGVPDVAGTISASHGNVQAEEAWKGNYIPEIAHALRGVGFDASEDGTGRGIPLVAPPLTAKMAKGTGGPSGDEVQNLVAVGGRFDVVAFDETQVTHPENRSNPQPGDPSPALASAARPPTIAFSAKDHGADATEDCSPTLRAGGFTSSHANGGVMPAVASGMQVRRLTPRECERLQGFEPVRREVTITVCGGLHESDAHAARPSRRSRASASPVGGNASLPAAPSAAEASRTDQADRDGVADLVVRIDCERAEVQIVSREKSLSCAAGAEARSAFPLPVGAGSFARLAVLTTLAAARSTLAGEAGSPPSTNGSSPRRNGSSTVVVSGDEIAAAAADAERAVEIAAGLTTSTTSRAGHDSPAVDSILRTLCCSVVRAIAGFIPERTRGANSFTVLVETVEGYTAIEGASDSARYMALGNSMAVPVVRWICERIGRVDSLLSPPTPRPA